MLFFASRKELQFPSTLYEKELLELKSRVRSSTNNQIYFDDLNIRQMYAGKNLEQTNEIHTLSMKFCPNGQMPYTLSL